MSQSKNLNKQEALNKQSSGSKKAQINQVGVLSEAQQLPPYSLRSKDLIAEKGKEGKKGTAP